MTADAAVDDLAALAGIVGVLADMLEEKNQDLAGLAERNAALEQQNGELAGRLKDMLERVAKLERQASRNSGNSGMSPSSDDLPGRTPPGPEAGARARQREEAGQAARCPRLPPGLDREPGRQEAAVPAGRVRLRA